MGDNHWPDPLELQEMQDAVEARKPSAIIGGRPFNFRYEEKMFWVTPVLGFVPRGCFEYDHAFDELKVEDGE